MSAPVPIAEVVDTEALLEVVWSSLLAGIGVTALFGVAIVGVTRAVDLSRDGHRAEALVLGALGAVALAGVAAAVGFGILAMVGG